MKKSLHDLLSENTDYQAIPWLDHEEKALFVARDRVLLRRRLNEAKACLLPHYRRLFESARFDFAGKRLIAGDFALQWLTRPRPDQPDSYENQQTTIGTCVLVHYSKTWRTGAPVQILDRASGERLFATIARAFEIVVTIEALGEFAPAVVAGNAKPQAARVIPSTALDLALSDGSSLEISVDRTGTTPDGVDPVYTVCPL